MPAMRENIEGLSIIDSHHKVTKIFNTQQPLDMEIQNIYYATALFCLSDNTNVLQREKKEGNFLLMLAFLRNFVKIKHFIFLLTNL